MSEKEVMAALKSGTKEQRLTATEVIDSAMQEIGQAESANRDPITKINEGIRLINNRLQRIADSALFSSDILVQVLFWTAKIAGLAGLALGLLQYLPNIMSFFGSGGLGGLMGGGGAAAGGGAAMGGGAAAGGTVAGVSIAGTAGAIVAPIMILIGAIKGWREAEEAGRTKMEGALLGILSGGAGTSGGFVGSILGTEKGTTGDKAAGVASGSLWGAGLGTAIGAAIGTFIFPGLGTAAGALIGGIVGTLVGMGTQFLKIITEGTDILATMLDPLQTIFDIITGMLGNVWGIISGIFTLDFNKVINNAFELVVTWFMAIPMIILSAFKAIFVGLPKLIMKAFSAVVFGIPKMIMDTIKSVFESLKTNEWVGPIFVTLSDAFNEIYDAFMTIWTPLKEAFDSIYNVFNDITNAIFGSSKEGSMMVTVLGWVKTGVKALATVIGWLLTPIKWLAQAIGGVLKIVGSMIKGIVDIFKWLYDVIIGHSIVPDLVYGIIKFFMMLPIRILKALGKLGIMAAKAIGTALLGVGGMLLQGVKSVFTDLIPWVGEKLYDGLVAVFVTFPMWLSNMIKNMFLGMPSVMKWIGEKLLQVLKAVFVDFPMWLGQKLLQGLTSGLAELGTWIAGVVSTALGAINAPKEIIDTFNDGHAVAENLKKSAESATAAYEAREAKSIPDKATLKAGEDPVTKLAELEASIANYKIAQSGQERNLQDSKKTYDASWGLFGLNPAKKAAKADMEYDEKILATTKNSLEQLEKAKLSLMEQAKAYKAKEKDNLAQQSQAAAKAVTEEVMPKAVVSVANTGAFEQGQAKVAFEEGMSREMKTAIQDGTLTKEMKTAIQDGTLTNDSKDTISKDATSLAADKLEKAYKEINQSTLAETSGGIGLGLFDNDNIGGAFECGVCAITSEMSESEGEYSELVDAADRLIDALYYASESKEQSSGGSLGLGLFDPTNILTAMEDGVGMLVSGVSNTFTDPVGTMKSVADGLAEFSKAPGEMIVNRLTNAFTEKSRLDKSDSRIADAGKGMYYSDTTENMTQGVVGNIVDSLMNTPVGKTIVEAFGLKAAQASTNLMDYSDDTKGQTSTNLLDYSDTTKGTVSAAMLGMTDPESRVSQEKYGSMPEGSIAGMSGIEDYLAQEQNLMKVMIEYLAKIETNTSPTKTIGKSVIGSDTKGLPQPEGLKMRRIAQEQGSGEWDLTFGDYSPSATTMSR